MKSIWFMASLVAGAVALAPGCSANPLYVGQIDGGGPVACASAGGRCVADASAVQDAGTPDARPGDKDGGSDGSAEACTSAGGTCVFASVSCALNAPTRAQDCNPAGAHCCLTLSDAGSDGDAVAADAARGHDDGGNSDGGPGAACVAAGGTCIGPAMPQCAIPGPMGAAQFSCFNPEAGTSFCCLRVQ